MIDHTILCSDCQIPFVFSEKEQEFFKSKGFQPPKRCRPCRELRRRERDGGTRNDDDPTNFPPR